MASAEESIFTDFDRRLTRLRKMCDMASRKALHDLLKWLNPTWRPLSMNFQEYLKTEKNASMKAFKSAAKPHQTRAIKKDPSGDSYDVSLLFILILWGNECLAPKDSDVWKNKDDACLEYLITSVKNVRNDLMHSYTPIEADEFDKRTGELRHLIKNMFNAVRNRCKHINPKEIEKTLQDLDVLIEKIRVDPLECKDFEDYENQLKLPQHQALIKGEGVKALQERHNKFTSLTPVSRLANVVFQVDDVFTEMVLEGRSQEKRVKVQLKDLLKGEKDGLTDKVIFLKGDTGVGKTTLTKKLVSVWSKKLDEVKHLETFDLVMHAECREHIESFKELLHSSMQEVSQRFEGEDMKLVTLSLKCLIIIDGFDELNKQSTKLFKEVLQMKKDYDNVTVLVTSRPEAVEKYENFANALNIQTKHILLIGIPAEKREDFVRKYYDGIDKAGFGSQEVDGIDKAGLSKQEVDGIEKSGLSKQEIDGLLQYLKRTQHSLGYLWKSPYNLSIITILWAMSHVEVNNITTSSELHWEIHELSLSKLRIRLQTHEDTQHLDSAMRDWKINRFLYILCRESLHALANDDVSLPPEVYEQFKKTCRELDLPVEEMVGTFLKGTDTSSGMRYSYPHKGLEDFLAANFILMQLTEIFVSSNILKIIKAINDTLNENNVPLHASHNILKFCGGELKSSENESTKPQQYDTEMITKEVDHVLTEKDVPESVRHNIISFTVRELRMSNHQHHNQEPHDSNVTWVRNVIEDAMKVNKVPTNLSDRISRLICENLERNQQDTGCLSAGPLLKGDAIRRIILEETSHCRKFPEITKLRNMFTTLIGLLYMERNKSVDQSIKMEALTLLQQTGVKDKEAWVNILNSVNCDESVALFIVEQSEILEGEVLITDSSLFAYISLMRALKSPQKDISEVNIYLDIKKESRGVDELLQLIGSHQYQVESILINDENVDVFTAALKSLTIRLKDAQDVNVDIDVSKDLYGLSELMFQIKRNDFRVRKLVLGTTEFSISEDNLIESLNLFESLPTLMRGVYGGLVKICIKKETPRLTELLKEVSRNHFIAEVALHHEYRNPSVQLQMEDAITSLFDRCDMRIYIGPLTPDSHIPPTVTLLRVNVVDKERFQALAKLFQNNPCTSSYEIAVPASIDVLGVSAVPILQQTTTVVLLVLDVEDKEADIEKACRIIKKIHPRSKSRHFTSVGFPRSSLSVQQIHRLLVCMEGVRIQLGVIFPTDLKPSPKEEEELQKLSREILSCDIKWGDVCEYWEM